MVWLAEGDLFREAVAEVRDCQKNSYKERQDLVYVLRALWVTWKTATSSRRTWKGSPGWQLKITSGGGKRTMGPWGRSPQKGVRRKGSVCLFLGHTLQYAAQGWPGAQEPEPQPPKYRDSTHGLERTFPSTHTLEHFKRERGEVGPQTNKEVREKMTR